MFKLAIDTPDDYADELALKHILKRMGLLRPTVVLYYDTAPSCKFYALKVNKNGYTVCYGKYGTSGMVTDYFVSDPILDINNIANRKIKKGYRIIYDKVSYDKAKPNKQVKKVKVNPEDKKASENKFKAFSDLFVH